MFDHSELGQEVQLLLAGGRCGGSRVRGGRWKGGEGGGWRGGGGGGQQQHVAVQAAGGCEGLPLSLRVLVVTVLHLLLPKLGPHGQAPRVAPVQLLQLVPELVQVDLAGVCDLPRQPRFEQLPRPPLRRPPQLLMPLQTHLRFGLVWFVRTQELQHRSI